MIENEIINYRNTEEQKENNSNNNQYSIELEDNYNDNDNENDNDNDNDNNNDKDKDNDNDNDNQNASKRLSTPSFKSPESEEGNMDNKNNKAENINRLKKINELLLKKIKEYESILKINQNKEEIEEENINNECEIDNNPINNDNLDINSGKNKPTNYLKLYKDYKKRCEFYETSNESLKNDILKAKTEIKELTKKLKENNIIVENHNNHITTLSSIKLNNQYNPKDYIILCDKTYENLKWFLIKKIMVKKMKKIKKIHMII